MRILGIDPGYGITGFGVVDCERGQSQLVRCGAITTPAGMDFSARLAIIYEDVRTLLAETKPDAVAIEELFFGQNVTTGIGVISPEGRPVKILHRCPGQRFRQGAKYDFRRIGAGDQAIDGIGIYMEAADVQFPSDKISCPRKTRCNLLICHYWSPLGNYSQ